jgi:hypothetical protein
MMESFYFKISQEYFDTCFEEITRLMKISKATSYKQQSFTDHTGVLVHFNNSSDRDSFIGKLQREISLFMS